jgi:hypothetical protein
MAHELYTASAITHPPNPNLPGIGGVLWGEGPPGVDLGSVGNVYINVSNGDVYSYKLTGWELQSGVGGNVVVATGTADPEGVETADPGTLYVNTTAHSLWFKETGVGTNTGWLQYV